MYLKNAVKHFMVITKHRWIVFKLCLKVGEPWRGLVHDLSKYSPTEFLESVKYFSGTCSPIVSCRLDKGYSQSWLHHKGRNKHHPEYWVDFQAPNVTPIMPYKYTAEMLCDKLAAGLVYKGKDWTKEYPLQYWQEEKHRIKMNEHLKDLITDFFTQVSKEGINNTLTKQNVKQLYKKYCVDI